MSRNTQITIAIIACTLIVLTACCCCALAGSGGLGWQAYQFIQEQLGFMLPEKVPSPTPELYQQVTAADRETLAALMGAEIPVRDQRQLAMRLKGLSEVPVVVRETPLPLVLGDRETFWVADNTDPEHVKYFQSEAELVYISDQAYFWVGEGFEVDLADLKQAAAAFEKSYETDRRVFGQEWSPGIDGDPRIHIFNGNVPAVGGYFGSSDQVSHLVNPHSNEREMFYINLNVTSPGDSLYDGVLSHEFQHMIHHHMDSNEPSWVNEGCSELASYLNGHSPSGGELLFPNFGPDLQLNTWSNDSRAILHYGASYAFMRYFYEQFGEEAVRAVVADPRDGEAGLAGTLTQHGYTFDAFFKQWTLANFLNDASIADGQYASPALAGTMRVDQSHSRYPVKRSSTVHQYGADYVVFEPAPPAGAQPGTLRVTFDGSDRARVLSTYAHSGDYFWYSHRGDSSHMTLTRRFDLGGLSSATLTFWTWYDIEHGWDYGYVTVSADGGQTWTVLAGPRTTDYNPAGNAFGPGYTGKTDQWVQEKIDLSPYAGQEILVRFEYVTDDAYNTPGWALDDIAVPELGYQDDIEGGEDGWAAQGFVRITNFLPQLFSVQFIVFDSSGTVTIHDLALDDTQQGTWELEGFGGETEKVVMVISGLTPVTTEWAYYTYQATLN